MNPGPRLSLPRSPEEIRFVAIGAVEGDVFHRLRPALEACFGVPVTEDEPMALLPTWYDAQRDQYRAHEILDALVARPRGAEWILAVTDADLFVPQHTFIFGQATVGGCCALVGLARLRSEFYGDEPDPDRFHRRVLVEAVHELGHVAGLEHCPNPSCVMHFSETIEDTDRKGPDFCSQCVP